MSNQKNLIIQRRVSREVFMKFIFQESANGDECKDLTIKLERFLDDIENDAIKIHESYSGREIEKLESYKDVIFDYSYLMDATTAYESNKKLVDDYINKYARNWTIDTLPKTDLAILRTAITEIKFMYTVPNKVACDEAVNIAKKYCDDDAYKYINGILGSIVEDKK